MNPGDEIICPEIRTAGHPGPAEETARLDWARFGWEGLRPGGARPKRSDIGADQVSAVRVLRVAHRDHAGIPCAAALRAATPTG